MFQFLRKYDKWILAVGGSLLMITFLVPQAIQGLSEYSAQTGATWATVGASSESVSAGEADMLRRQTRLIDLLGAGTPLGQLGVGNNPAHWYLLVREAAAAGLIAGTSSGYDVAQSIAAEPTSRRRRHPGDGDRKPRQPGRPQPEADSGHACGGSRSHPARGPGGDRGTLQRHAAPQRRGPEVTGESRRTSW